MKASVIAIGSEMLTPFRVDTNSLAITDRLNAIGCDVRFKVVVGDDVGELSSALATALEATDLVVCTGGLGPTEDDVTREALARVLHAPLGMDASIAEQIRLRFERRGLAMGAINRRQAMVPRGAVVIENKRGTAPGLWLERGGRVVLALPGPHLEMTLMLEDVIRERLGPRTSGAGLFRRTVKTISRLESDVDALVAPVYSHWLTQPIPVTTTVLGMAGGVELHLTAGAGSREQADRVLDSAVDELQASLGSAVYSVDGRGLEAVVGDLLRAGAWTVAAAESCTGGLLTSRLTDVPGSSAYVDCGLICYSNGAKTEWLGVSEALIAEHGAVSEPVALAMANGVRTRAGTRVGIGVTGIAGPGGGTVEKPVGTVAVAVVTRDDARVKTFRLHGSRESVKFQAAQAAMNMLRLMLLEEG